MKKVTLFLSLLLMGSTAFAVDKIVVKEGIKFVEPTSAGYKGKADLAYVDYNYPLEAEALKKLSQDALKKLGGEELDQLYARLTAGPIPDGPFKGQIVFTKDGGLKGMANYMMDRELLNDIGFKALMEFGEYMWDGKRFYRDQRVLRNLIPHGAAQWVAIKTISNTILKRNPDTSKFVHSKHWGTDYHELFPAKLYCGQSLFDSRRESVIIDYFYSKEIPGYQPEVDILASGEGLSVRDEIRMIRPGLYLGRAYIQKNFGLYFTLYNEDIDKQFKAGKLQIKEDCWTGTQKKKQ